MKTLDKGHDKIRKISEGIKNEVLEPARREAEKIIDEAKQKAELTIKEAEEHAQKIIESAKTSIEHERNVFHSSLSQSAKQTLESLRQSIENKLFNQHLEELVASQSADPKLIANLISAIVSAIQKDGLAKHIDVLVPKCTSSKEINQLLGQEILNSLKGGSVSVGEFSGGAQVKLLDKQLTLDITDKTLADYLRHYARKDFRKLIFAND